MLPTNEKKHSAHDISYYAVDGRLTAEPDGKRYRWNEMIGKYRELGRALTEDEADAYRVKSFAELNVK
ncbi:hypothetical protein FYJ84_13195 [Veillonellaceae bacterium WCA-693-APC-5D-A]|uniref:Uncharacterized protein n=1 Tax=Anaerovibrio slackiae TaxID=2652309 RepID=A0A6I2UJM3_9FIRM|nr:hypothetical protein [Anaerovibrio slackiae]MSU09925.1 hypothetical protein [Anaerovibrio slackiae]